MRLIVLVAMVAVLVVAIVDVLEAVQVVLGASFALDIVITVQLAICAFIV